MIKNYLHHNGKTYYRGTYKTFKMAEKWGKIDLKRHATCCEVLGKPDNEQYIEIVATLSDRKIIKNLYLYNI
jgi:hypothetical protein